MELIQKVALVAAAPAATYAAFKALQDAASAGASLKLSTWLQESYFTRDRTAQVHEILFSVFVSILGPTIFKVRFAACSIVLSFLGVLLFCGVIPLVLPDPNIRLILWPNMTNIHDTLRIAIWGFLIAALSDYLSLAKTALMIRSLDFFSNYTKYYLLDLSLSIIMSMGWIFLALNIIEIANHALGFALHPPDAVIFYVTLLTSLLPTFLILLFLIGTALAKALIQAGRPLDYLRLNVLDIHAKPFHAVGVLLAPPSAAVSAVFIFVAG